MGLLRQFLTAISSDLEFKLAWKRLSHIKNGHTFENSILIDKLISELHPHTSESKIYTINIRKCRDCGLMFLDKGLEYRNGSSYGDNWINFPRFSYQIGQEVSVDNLFKGAIVVPPTPGSPNTDASMWVRLHHDKSIKKYSIHRLQIPT